MKLTNQLDSLLEQVTTLKDLKSKKIEWLVGKVVQFRGRKWGKKGKEKMSWNEEYKRNKSRTVSKILLEKPLVQGKPKLPEKAAVKSFYGDLYRDDSNPGELAQGFGTFEPCVVSSEEFVMATKRLKKSAVGLDKIRVGELKAAAKSEVVTAVVVKLFNKCMTVGVPDWLKRARVVLLPKREGACRVGDFRPVSVTSNLYRVFCRLVYARLENCVGDKLSNVQSGFRRGITGCQQNLALLKSIVAFAHVKRKNLCGVSIDLAKCFDTLKHNAVRDALIRFKVPGKIASVAMSCLEDVAMEVGTAGGKVMITPRRGVAQGNPLSGLLFIMAINDCLSELNGLLPFQNSDGGRIGAIALADDLCLFAESELDLSYKTDYGLRLLDKLGFKVNAGKCHAFGFRKLDGVMKPRRGKLRINPEVSIKYVGRGSQYKYLGVVMENSVKLKLQCETMVSKMRNWCKSIEGSKLSVAHKLNALRVVIIPKILYLANNTNIVSVWPRKRTAGARTRAPRVYLELDHIVDQTLKRVLRIKATGVNTDMLYLPQRIGGLGMPRLNQVIPIARLKLLDKLRIPGGWRDIVEKFSFGDTDVQKQLLQKQGFKDQIPSLEERVLVNVASMRTRVTCRYLPVGTKNPMVRLLRRDDGSGVGFGGFRLQRAIRVRLNAMPTNAFKARYSTQDPLCRICKRSPETIGHICNAKDCSIAVKEFWISRHNRVVKKISDRLEKHKIKHFVELDCRSARPDIIIVKDAPGTCSSDITVLDVAIVWENETGLNLVERSDEKKTKYQSQKDSIIAGLRAQSVGTRYYNTAAAVFGARGMILPPCNRIKGLLPNAGRLWSECAEVAFNMTAKHISQHIEGEDLALYGNSSSLGSTGQTNPD